MDVIRGGMEDSPLIDLAALDLKDILDFIE
jgi:hypothetical protein